MTQVAIGYGVTRRSTDFMSGKPLSGSSLLLVIALVGIGLLTRSRFGWRRRD